MRVLSIKQPWAWAILNAGKDIENRDWFTNFRGRIGIHASKGMTRNEYDDFYFFIREIEDKWLAISTLPQPEQLHRGAILGTVEIVDCVRDSGSPWFVGEYGFVLRNPVILPEPIPYKGQLGLWDCPELNEEPKRNEA